MGQAGSYYRRSVPPERVPMRLRYLADLFDALLARTAYPNARPMRTSSILFVLTTMITHDLFRNGDKDEDLTTASSYLDLSLLYGCRQEVQDRVQAMVDGKLKTDTFAEIRFINQPLHVSGRAVYSATSASLLTTLLCNSLQHSLQHSSSISIVLTIVLPRN